MLINHSNCQIHVFIRILRVKTEYLGGGIFYNGLDTLLMGHSVHSIPLFFKQNKLAIIAQKLKIQKLVSTKQTLETTKNTII